MTKVVFFILISFVTVTVGCRSRKVSVVAGTSSRRADSVATLKSLAARELVGVWEETIVSLRPDSTGAMKEVARDVRRKTFNATETASTADTMVVRSEAAHEDKTETLDESTRPKESRQSAAAFVAGVWVAFIVLAVALVAILLLKWKSRI